MSNAVKTLLIAAAAIAAPAAASPAGGPDAKLEKMLAGRVAGEPVGCIPLRGATSSRVVDGRAIVYRVGATLYVNEPRAGGDLLDDDDLLVTRTIGSQLCRIDTVQLVDQVGLFPRGFVVLGDFVPYTRAKRAN